MRAFVFYEGPHCFALPYIQAGLRGYFSGVRLEGVEPEFCLHFFVFAFGGIVDEFIELPDEFHQRVVDFWNFHSADTSPDEVACGVDVRGGAEEFCEVCVGVEKLVELIGAVSSQPADAGVNHGGVYAFALHFGFVVRVDR
ncbi:hypothetical protein CFELI_11140 [Corynebacterium felinum]|nr:hypothetical protein CFELI_11140 [Corynebacterium felinum]